MSDADDLDLASLPDDELVTQMHEDLYDGVDDIINASDFIEMTDGAQLLFI